MRLGRHDFHGFLGTVFIHGVLVVALLQAPIQQRRGAHIVEIDVKRKQPPPPPPLPPPELPRAKAKPRPAPLPNETPKETTPSKEPVKPVFGVSASSTTGGDSSFAVPVGNTTVTDPSRTAPIEEVRPLPPPPPPPPAFRAASPLTIKDQPEVIGQSCDIPSRLYPEEARQQGIEGDTDLRVEIDASGKVRSARVLASSAKMLDDLALFWMRAHCKFKPAKNSAGQAVDYVITYTFHWQLER